MRVKGTFYRQNNFNKNDNNDENIVHDFYYCVHISTHDIIYGNISNNNNCNINDISNKYDNNIKNTKNKLTIETIINHVNINNNNNNNNNYQSCKHQ